jgi:hypothetical protein
MSGNTAISSPASVIVVGGRDSGKSNFIFRLWLAMKDGAGALRENGLPDQLDYLKVGSQSLLKGQFAQRTQEDVASINIIPFSTPAGDETGNLVVPDCQGERWTAVFTKREWTSEWEERIADPCGVLIFVRASSKEIAPSLSWVECEQMFGVPLLNASTPENFVAPTQVVITDLIQFFGKAFLDRMGSSYRPRIALVISAWDLVPHDMQEAGPKEYIAREFPLLAQFVESNDDLFDFAMFGVTIAGGDFNTQPDFKANSLNQDSPVSGGYVVHELEGTPRKQFDLTIPVVWAMDLMRKAGV